MTSWKEPWESCEFVLRPSFEDLETCFVLCWYQYSAQSNMEPNLRFPSAQFPGCTLVILVSSILRHRGMGQQDFFDALPKMEGFISLKRDQLDLGPLVLPQSWSIPYLVSLTMGYPIKIRPIKSYSNSDRIVIGDLFSILFFGGEKRRSEGSAALSGRWAWRTWPGSGEETMASTPSSISFPVPGWCPKKRPGDESKWGSKAMKSYEKLWNTRF